MEQTNQFYKEILENLHDGVYFVDPERQITFWNKGAERITGYTAARMVGAYCYMNILNHVTEDGKQLCMEGCPLVATIQDGRRREAEVYLRHANGFRLPVLVRVMPIYGRGGDKIIGAVETFSDISSQKSTQRRVLDLENDALMDPLTTIGNRRFMEIKLDSAIHEHQQQQIPCGLLFLDIDDFKDINDTYGHNMGDAALKIITSTMAHNMRASDVIGRWGGDEFLALIFNIDAKGLETAAEKLRMLIENAQVEAEGHDIRITVSIGATLIQPGDTRQELVDRADRSMYESKRAGGNRISITPP